MGTRKGEENKVEGRGRGGGEKTDTRKGFYRVVSG